MYETGDTICAVSSAAATGGQVCESIIRISGPDAFSAAGEVFSTDRPTRCPGVTTGIIAVDGLTMDAALYAFAAPRSYTGEDLAELHFFAAGCVVERVMVRLLGRTRAAGPGEFTLRAYLNGRIDLSQAEAVAQIVSASNTAQLAAAGKLLAGRLARTIADLRRQILDLLSLLEAGMDFSGEEIAFVTTEEAVASARHIRSALRQVLDGGIRYEAVIDLPSVGLAGAANAGKSSLLNAMLGQPRSIVSDARATTRDVLTGILQLEQCRCVLFDCAGLGPPESSAGLLDELGRRAAVEAVNAADLVLFCVDLSKHDYDDDVHIRRLIVPGRVVVVGTKSDLVAQTDVPRKSAELAEALGGPVIVASARTTQGIAALGACIEAVLIELTAGAGEAADRIAINQRHHTLVSEAVGCVDEAIDELAGENDEIAAMLLRSAYERLAGLEKEDIDEAILERIFSNFCIGK